MSYVVILSDSRGKGLGELIQRNLKPDSVVCTRIYGGADFPKLHEELVNIIPYIPTRFNDTIVIISAGICSLTIKTRNAGNHEVSYPSSRRQQITQQIDNLIAVCIAHNFKLIFTGIYSASLEKSAAHFAETGTCAVRSWSSEDTVNQQVKLESDINYINSYIAEKAKSTQCAYIYVNLQKHITKRSTKSYKGVKKVVQYLSYSDLPDGIHPNDKLKGELFSKILNALNHMQSLASESTTGRQPTAAN